MNYTTKKSILTRAEELCGKTYLQLVKLCGAVLGTDNDKGQFGSLIETCYGMERNSKPAPDFEEAGIELKVTPMLRYKNKSKGFRAKERLVCNIIDYCAEASAKNFYESSFAHKCAQMLIFFYLAEPAGDGSKGTLFDYSLMILKKLPRQDLATIVHDWEIIHAKIIAGKAHEISEGDTNYLAACTKGATAATAIRKQPFSDIPARQRAYSLKSSYMTEYIRQHADELPHIYAEIRKYKPSDNSLYRPEDAPEDLESFVTRKISPFLGKKLSELGAMFDVRLTSKSCAAMVFRRVFKASIRSEKDILEFRKANIRVKTITLDCKGNLKESMSFPYFKANELMQEADWESSGLYTLLSETRFLFVVLQRDGQGDMIFKRICFWNMPVKDLNGPVQKVWHNTRSVIQSGDVYVQPKTPNEKRKTKFVHSADELIVHVRPHGANSSDVDCSWPGVKPFTKHCFWINRAYIKGILEHGN